MIHGHGNDLLSCKTIIETDFSSNVWYKGMDTGLRDFLCHRITYVENYPEPDAGSLRAKIAAYHGVDAENVLVFNGSTDAFYTIAQAFTHQSSTIVYPCFAEYADACAMYGHSIEYIPNNSNWYSRKFDNQLVWLANPNNPDGKIISLYELESLLRNNPGSVFVVDEAYIDLCYGAETSISLLTTFPNLIIVRSLTKAFAIPGLRLGYVLSGSEIAQKLSLYLKPWSVNTLAILAGTYIVDNYQTLLPSKDAIFKESEGLQAELSQNNMLEVYPSQTNFFLVKTLHGTAAVLKEYLIYSHCLMIRDASNFKGLGTSHFRLAIQGPSRNKQLVKAINQWMML